VGFSPPTFVLSRPQARWAEAHPIRLGINRATLRKKLHQYGLAD